MYWVFVGDVAQWWGMGSWAHDVFIVWLSSSSHAVEVLLRHKQLSLVQV